MQDKYFKYNIWDSSNGDADKSILTPDQFYVNVTEKRKLKWKKTHV